MYEEMEAPPARGQKARRYVSFSHHPVKNEAKSKEAGRPIFDSKEYVEIAVPGDKSNIVHRPVRPSDRHEFPEEYRRFKAGEEALQSGTPLAQWPGISRAEVLELQHFRIHTVEQLADLTDGNAKNVGPVLALRDRARDFIAAAKGAAPLEKVRAENAALQNEVDTLKKQMQTFMESQAKKGGK